MEGSSPPSAEQYREGVARGYQAVGLTDATLSSSVTGESHGLPFFTSEVTFTNNGAPMIARILIVQYHDRTYTASAIATADPLEAGRALITPLIDGIEVDGQLVRDTRPPVNILNIVGAVFTAALLTFIVLRRTTARGK
jgi:hypothetical protein